MIPLNQTIAENIKRIRKSKNMSLDMLSVQSGVSKSMLGQIERGESNPTITIVGKIVEGLKISFEELIVPAEEVLTVTSVCQAPVLKEKKGAYCVRLLLPFDTRRNFEVYEAYIYPGACMEEVPRTEKAWEYIKVMKGSLNVVCGEKVCKIQEDDYIRICAESSRMYINRSSEPAKIHITTWYEKDHVL